MPCNWTTSFSFIVSVLERWHEGKEHDWSKKTRLKKGIIILEVQKLIFVIPTGIYLFKIHFYSIVRILFEFAYLWRWIQKSMCQLRLTMTKSPPPIWRIFQVPESYSLNKHLPVIQLSFAWTNSHLYMFGDYDNKIGDPILWEDCETPDTVG